MPLNYAYIRISDKYKQDSDTQKSAITKYANEKGIMIDEWLFESISGSKTKTEDREISGLISKLSSGDKLICTEISRLGRDKPFSIIGLINDIAEVKQAELHLVYSEQCITPDNVEDAEVLFTTVAGSYVARQEAVKRSERAKAAIERRKGEGLHNGRPKGLWVKSKLDEREDYIVRSLNDGIPKALLATDLNVGRTTLITWLKNRKAIHDHARTYKLDTKMEIYQLKKELNKIIIEGH